MRASVEVAAAYDTFTVTVLPLQPPQTASPHGLPSPPTVVGAAWAPAVQLVLSLPFLAALQSQSCCGIRRTCMSCCRHSTCSRRTLPRRRTRWQHHGARVRWARCPSAAAVDPRATTINLNMQTLNEGTQNETGGETQVERVGGGVAQVVVRLTCWGGDSAPCWAGWAAKLTSAEHHVMAHAFTVSTVIDKH